MYETRTPSMPSRRAVTKVAAWSAPVIAAAVAAPALAASPIARKLSWSRNGNSLTLEFGGTWSVGDVVTISLVTTQPNSQIKAAPGGSGFTASNLTKTGMKLTLAAVNPIVQFTIGANTLQVSGGDQLKAQYSPSVFAVYTF